MEGKYQILTVCLVYQLKKNLFNNLKNEHPIRASKKSQNHIFKFLINSPSEKPGTQKLIARLFLPYDQSRLCQLPQLYSVQPADSTAGRPDAGRHNKRSTTDEQHSGRPSVLMHTSVVHPVLPHQNMQVILTDNRDKQSRVVNGQEALILLVPNRTIILRLPQGQHVFVYPITAIVDDTPVTYHPFTPAYV